MTTRTYRASATEHQEQAALIEWCRALGVAVSINAYYILRDGIDMWVTAWS